MPSLLGLKTTAVSSRGSPSRWQLAKHRVTRVGSVAPRTLWFPATADELELTALEPRGIATVLRPRGSDPGRAAEPTWRLLLLESETVGPGCRWRAFRRRKARAEPIGRCACPSAGTRASAEVIRPAWSP